MGLLALTDWLHSPVSVAVMVIASVITVSDNGLAFTAIAEIAGPFWSGRALGTQNTSQLLTAGVAPPVFGGLIGVAGYPVAFAVCALFPLIAMPLVPVDDRIDQRRRCAAIRSARVCVVHGRHRKLLHVRIHHALARRFSHDMAGDPTAAGRWPIPGDHQHRATSEGVQYPA